MQLCKIFVALLGAIRQIVPVLLVTAETKTSILSIIDKQVKKLLTMEIFFNNYRVSSLQKVR